MKYHIVNGFLHLIHLSIVFASVFLWIFPAFRIWHLILQGLILFSWLGIGSLRNDPGFCLITDWQRQWNKKYGYSFPVSYMIYLYQKLHLNAVNKKTVDTVTFGVFTGTSVISLFLSI